MLTPDPTIDVAAVAALVDEEYGLSEPLQFVPAGGDSWCYASPPWWVSVRRDRGGHHPGAYEAAVALRRAGLEFVLAPVVGRSGRVVHGAGGRPVVVFELVEGSDLSATDATAGQVAAVASMVEQVHTATVDVDVPREDFRIHFLDELDNGVRRALAGAADAGPYGAPTSALVRANEGVIAGLRAELEDARARCVADPGPFVLTHGEPTNVFVRADGELLLMDWTALAWGPRERDWWSLVGFGLPWPPGTLGHVRRFYELSWILSEVAEYVDRFTRPHPGDVADDDKWSELLLYLRAPE